MHDSRLDVPDTNINGKTQAFLLSSDSSDTIINQFNRVQIIQLTVYGVTGHLACNDYWFLFNKGRCRMQL